MFQYDVLAGDLYALALPNPENEWVAESLSRVL